MSYLVLIVVLVLHFLLVNANDGLNLIDVDTGSDENGIDILELPPPNPSDSESLKKVKFGETVSFDELGPMILNKDGTVSRIQNWESLTKQEKDSSWRRISERNRKRSLELHDHSL